jgi:hypothetical protein
MLKRYPVKPKRNKSSNTLASKNLYKVYGKIKTQFNKNINAPDPDYFPGLPEPPLVHQERSMM